MSNNAEGRTRMRTERVEQVDEELALERNDFTASATDIRVDIEALPEMVDRRRACVLRLVLKAL